MTKKYTRKCVRNSDKRIIKGKNGEMLKRIGTLARKELEDTLAKKVNLKLWVKVKQEWQDDEKIIENFKIK